MGGNTTRRVASTTLIGLCELCVLHEAFAGPPAEKIRNALNHASVDGLPALTMQAPGSLDLRPPSDLLPAMTPSGFRAAEWFSRAPLGGFAPAGVPIAGVPIAGVPAAGSPAAPSTSESGHVLSRMQLMAHSFRQQGLPLAKLIETKDSLVHLGLNQKGKPGIWFVHNLH